MGTCQTIGGRLIFPCQIPEIPRRRGGPIENPYRVHVEAQALFTGIGISHIYRNQMTIFLQGRTHMSALDEGAHGGAPLHWG
jgi:hypothetical protein